ncbi:hypothetical protein MSPP1_003161 [Malassezia sp. CBS 17886]|nr:hypothetical protein MSPP1_003161 [Malassezia sp. CBS 17886]
MSLPDLLGGGAECGPVNPLQQLGKRFGQDHGAQFDRTGTMPRGAEGSAAPFRSRPVPVADDPAFFAHGPKGYGDALGTFHVDQLRHALPGAPQGSAWSGPRTPASSMALRHPPPEMEAPFAHAGRADQGVATTAGAPAWARDFMAQGTPGVVAPARPHATETRHAAAPFAPRYGRPMGYAPMWQGDTVPHAGMQRAAPGTAPAYAEGFDRVHPTSWESAFTAADAAQRTVAEAAGPTEAPAAEAALDAMDADELAATAARLLSSVENDTSDKFRQSEFLGLMRRLRDRQAEVQGAHIVDADAHAGAKGKARERGADGAAPAQSAGPSQTASPLSRASLAELMRGAHAGRTGDHAAPAPQVLHPDVQRELDDMWAEEDAAKEAAQPRPAVDAGHAFIGDGGDVAARMREDEEQRVRDDETIAREFKKWTSMPGVAGARAGWEEDIMATDARASAEETPGTRAADTEDFVGRAWHGTQGRGRAGAQEAEWARLQSDWDEFEAHDDGVYSNIDRTAQPFPYAAPAYHFHDNNPYRAGMTRHHAHHALTTAESVLEHEAQVQAEPRSADAWYGLGMRQQENEREKQAIAALRKAVDLDPHMKDAWLALAVSYTNENDRTEALESIERWIHASDEYRDAVRAYLNARDTHADRHTRLARVLMAMARSRTGEVDADVQVALGVLFNASNEYDKAVDCFATALEVRPDDWLLYNRIGATLSNSGRSRESLEHYHQALSLRPGFARCHFNLSISCLNLKMYQDAAEHAFTALTLQHASDDDLPHGAGSAQNSSLWEVLRVSLELRTNAGAADRSGPHERDPSARHA